LTRSTALSGRVLVTGGTGLVGGALVRALRERDTPVTALARSASGGQALEALGARVVRGDLSDGPHLDDALDGAERVLHLAARAGDFGREEQFRADNVDATVRLARRAARAGVRRFVHTSSISVYGYASLGEIDEEEPTPRIPSYPYAESKRLAEVELAALDPGEMQVVVARLGSVYGPGSHHWTARPARLMTSGLGLPLIDGGAGLQNPIYLDDAVEGLRVLAAHEAVSAGAFFVTDGALPYREFFAGYARALDVPFRHRVVPRGLALALVAPLEMIAKARAKPPQLTRIAVRVLCRKTAFSPAKLFEVTGFRPRVSLDDGQARCAAWLRQTGVV
jgi:nucleoside-diphosphate-sugar epimerase